MTTPMALPERERLPWRIRLVAHLAVALARLLFDGDVFIAQSVWQNEVKP